VSEIWAKGDAYEAYVGRWSRAVAAEFLDWLAAGPQLRWLDVGCGTGALTATILDRCDPVAVLGVDASEGFLASATARVDDARARFELGDAARLPAAAADVAVSGLVLNFLPDPSAAVAAMRAAAPTGVVAAYVWDYAEKMELMRHFWDAAVALDPKGHDVDESARFPICRPDRLDALWRDAGRDHASHRCAHRVRRLRRLLDAVPRWTGPGTGVRDVVGRTAPGRAAGSHPGRPAGRRGRLDQPDRASVGRPWPLGPALTTVARANSLHSRVRVVGAGRLPPSSRPRRRSRGG